VKLLMTFLEENRSDPGTKRITNPTIRTIEIEAQMMMLAVVVVFLMIILMQTREEAMGIVVMGTIVTAATVIAIVMDATGAMDAIVTDVTDVTVLSRNSDLYLRPSVNS